MFDFFLVLLIIISVVLLQYIMFPQLYKTSYFKLLTKANRFTIKEWGKFLKSSEVVFPPIKYDDEKIQMILSIIQDYVCSKGGVENIALKCNLICIEIHELLKTEYNIHSIVTSGYYLLNGKKSFYINKNKIITQFGKSGVKLEHHVWLTIGDYVIDPTLMFSIYWVNPCYFSKQTFIEHMIIFYRYESGSIVIENDTYEYIPQFVGKSYYVHTQLCGKLHLVVQDP